MEKIRNNMVRPMAKDPSKSELRTKPKSKVPYLAEAITTVVGQSSGEKKVLGLDKKLECGTSTEVKNKKNPIKRNRKDYYALELPSSQSWSKFRKKMRAKGLDF